MHRLTYRRRNHAAAARARIQGERHHHHAVRHGDAQRPRPVPPGHGRHRPRARPRPPGRPGCARRWSTPGCRARAWTREHGEDIPEVRRLDLARLSQCGVLDVNAGSTSLKLSRARRRRGVAHLRVARRGARRRRRPDAVAHRVVHGGRPDRRRSSSTTPCSPSCARLIELAPLHQPPALGRGSTSCRSALARRARRSPASTPPSTRPSRRRPGPTRCPGGCATGSASTASTGSRTRGRPAGSASWRPSARRVVVAHLGGGQSLCGVLDGRSVDDDDGLSRRSTAWSWPPAAARSTPAPWPGVAANTADDLTEVAGAAGRAARPVGTADMRELRSRPTQATPTPGSPSTCGGTAWWGCAGPWPCRTRRSRRRRADGGIGEHNAAVHAGLTERLASLSGGARCPSRRAHPRGPAVAAEAVQLLG